MEKTPLANRSKPSWRNNLLRQRPLTNDIENATSNTMRTRKKFSILGCMRANSAYIFIFCVLVAFMKAGFYAGHNSSDAVHLKSPDPDWITKSADALPFTARMKSVVKEHPIEKLMEDGEEKYRAKVGSQSKTLRAAVDEYKRRHKRPPPKGFDLWWKFAQQYNVKMVDEYDGLIEDLAPFWEISGEELRRRSIQVGELPSIDLVRLRDGKSSTVNMHHGFQDSEVSARAQGFRAMMSKFENTLPDMDFPINAKAEGRVLVPWEHRHRPNLTVQDSSAGIASVLGGEFRADWADDGNVWEAWRRTCPPGTPARQLYSSVRDPFSAQSTDFYSTLDSSSATAPGIDFSFVANTSSHVDYCHSPQAHYTQGHFFSDWRSIPALYPVFSPAKAKGFLDIKIPSHYYYGSTQRYTYGWDPINLELKNVDPMEVPWENKMDKVFWRGATTGGGNHPPGFAPQFQRHRFLRMASDKSSNNRTVTFADPPSSSRYVAARVPVAKLNEELMDTAFVKAVAPGGYPGGMQALLEAHRFGDSVPLGRHWAYKYLVDLDGMSYSGRFMAFLASDSVPVKATVYDEYFSDWIQPWVHFIPLSSSYRELYNIIAYFSGPTQSALESLNSTSLELPKEQRRPVEGDVRLRRIARAGKQWKQTMGRPIDMEAYVYRLCLEWARLQADDRDSMNYSL